MAFGMLPVVLLSVAALALTRLPSCAQPEFRAFWVDAFHDGFKTQGQIDDMLAVTRATNCNAIVVQVRKRGDTYYPSPYEPWASDATPGFDSLAYLIQQAHGGSPRIEVHAWLCTLPIASGVPTDPAHPYNKYPQFLTKSFSGGTSDGGTYSFDPGHPGALDYTTNVFLDVARRYDVDGIHFDLVRFASAQWGYNDVSVARFNSRFGRAGLPDPEDEDWKQWRRDQVTSLVRKVYANAIAIKPAIKVSASTITWGDGPADDDAYRASSSAYTAVMQDWRSWMEEGILDINTPMCYDREYLPAQRDYFENWIRYIKDRKFGRHAAVGLGIYLNRVEDTITQIYKTRLVTDAGNAADGVLMYSYASTNDQFMNGSPYNDVPAWDFYNALTNPSDYSPDPPFAEPVDVPDMPWKSAPTRGHIKGSVTANDLWVDGASITLTGPDDRVMTCDGTGFYAFIDLSPGEYTVSCTCPVGSDTRQVTVTAGAVATVDFAFNAPVPSISNVAVSNVTPSGFTVTWNTDLPATTRLEYGLTRDLGSATAEDLTPKTSHSAAVNGLPGLTACYFRAVANASAPPAAYSEIGCAMTLFQPDTIVDNLDGAAIPDANWQTGTGANKYGADYRFCSTAPGGTNIFEWRPSLPVAANYEVYVWYPAGSNRSNVSPFTVFYKDSQSLAKAVNQQTNGGGWYVMLTPAGGVPFAAGTDGYVRLTNDAPSGKVVMADAVKFRLIVPESNPPSAPTGLVVESVQTDSVTLTWSASTDDTGIGGYKVFRNGALVGTATGTTFTDDGLTANKAYSYTVSAYDVFGAQSAASGLVDACTLSVAPTLANVTADKPVGLWLPGGDITFTAVGGFGEGRVDRYSTAWDNNPTRQWDGPEGTWSSGAVTRTALSSAQPWYFHVQGFNLAGAANGALDIGPFYYDATAPNAPVVRDGGLYTIDRSHFAANWPTSDPESGVVAYSYAVGTEPERDDILGWTSTTSWSVQVTVPERPYSSALYFSVKARNAAGAWSPVGSSDGIRVAWPLSSIAEAKVLPAGEAVSLQFAKPITAVFDGFCYIEEPSRCAGIRVDLPGAEVGKLASVAGVVTDGEGERRLAQVEASVTTPAPDSPKPLAVTGKMLGGTYPGCFAAKAWRWVKRPGMDRAVREFGPVSGISSAGLLVKTWGKVSAVGQGSFYLDDGSGFDETESGIPAGVKVLLPPGAAAPAVGDRVSVVAISSSYESGGEVYRLLRISRAEDITVLAGL